MAQYIMDSAFFAYRTFVFASYGIFSFTRYGFERAEKHFTPQALDVNLEGKAAIVTGANSGLGKETALELAKRGASVYMVCRNERTGTLAKDQIINESNNPNVHLSIVDMSRPTQIVQFIQQFPEKKVDILVNNAGAAMDNYQQTPEGLEVTFATNTLGTYIMTERLVNHLTDSKEPRVITVSSGGAYTVPLESKNFMPTNNHRFDGVQEYAQTKRAQLELTDYWAKKYPNITFYSTHPGWADTPIVQQHLPGFNKMLGSAQRNPSQGADTMVWAAISKEVLEKYSSGSFLFDRKSVWKHIPFGRSEVSEETRLEFIKNLDAIASQF